MLRPNSLVVADCSSTALATVVWNPSIRETTSAIRAIASTAASVSDWIASTRRAMSPVACPVCCASSLTSAAT
jgi:hypothetical protein